MILSIGAPATKRSEHGVLYPYERALGLSWKLAQVDHRSGAQVQTYSTFLICLWGVEHVVYI